MTTDVLATVLLVFAACAIAALALVYAVSGYTVLAAICGTAAAVSVLTAWRFWRDILRDDDRSDR